MDSFFEKLDKLSKALGQFKASIKQPKLEGVKTPKAPKMPGNAPKSKKDPVKVAEQIQNPDLKPMKMDAAKQLKETLKTSKNGQWSLKTK